MRLKGILITNENGETIFQGVLTSLPLKEDTIIKKSIELFNDSEPCIIHKSYTMKKLFFEVENFFINSLDQGNKELLHSQIPSSITNIIDLAGSIYKLL